MGALRIRIVDSRKDFESLAPVWNSLLSGSGSDSPFMTHEWFESCQDSFFLDRKPYILVVEKGSNIVGIAPFARRRVGGSRVIEFLGGRHADYQDVILCPENRSDGIRLILDTLTDGRDPWDVVDLRKIRHDSPNLPLLECPGGWRGKTHLPGQHEVSPILPIKWPWEEFLTLLRKKFVKDTQRQIRRLESMGELRLRKAESESEVDRYLNVCHRQKEERRYGNGVAVDPLGTREGRRFLRDFSLRALDRGWLDLRSLELKGAASPIALSVSFLYRDRYYYWFPSIDSRMRSYSPGRVLLFYLLRECFKGGASEFDFLSGPESYKYEWLACDMGLHRVTVYNSGWRGWSCRLWKENVRPRMRESRRLTHIVRRTRKIVGHS